MKLFAIVEDIGWQDSEFVSSIWTDRAKAETERAKVSSRTRGNMAPTVVVEFDSDKPDSLVDAITAATP